MTGPGLDQLDEVEGVPVLDLFAGHGWGVACQALGLREYGVELMPEARAVREANGMTTIFGDVWDGLEKKRVLVNGTGANAARRSVEAPAPTMHFGGRLNSVEWQDEDTVCLPDYALLIASPPCQTFSMAGSGAGRKALDEVLGLIDDRAYLDVAKLRAFGESHDPRTALVLTPLAYVARDAPLYVVLEQVPPVLPVWERYAEEMRRWGYSVWTGVVNAEQYGVPQTRKRAILIARADGIAAAPPEPTHSRYYSRDPKRLDDSVQPWVSMAEALGWAEGEYLVGNQVPPGNARDDYHARRADAPSQSMTSNAGSMQRTTDGRRVMRSNYGTGGDPKARGERAEAEPAPTVMSKAGRNKWEHERPATTLLGDDRVFAPGHKTNQEDRDAGREYPGRPEGAQRITVAEAAALQSYPPGFVWDVDYLDPRDGKIKPVTKTKTFLQIGNAVPPLLARAILSVFPFGGAR